VVFSSLNLTASKLCYFQFQKASEKALKEFLFYGPWPNTVAGGRIFVSWNHFRNS
jgi:hypothetical protein